MTALQLGQVLLYDHQRDGALKVGAEVLLVYADGHTEKVPAPEAKEPKVETGAWGKLIHYDGGYAWGIAPDLATICLGKEGVVRAAVKNEKLKCGDPVIDGIIALERQLERGLSDGEYEVRPAVEQRTIKTRGVRARPATHSEYKPVSTRHVKARSGLPGGPVKPPQSRVYLINSVLDWLKKNEKAVKPDGADES